MTPEQLREIAKKYLEGSATKEEEALLHEYYSTVSSELTETVITESITTAEQLGQEMFVAIREKMEKQETAKKVYLPQRRWPRIAVAASFLLLISLGAYYVLFNKPDQHVQADNTVHSSNDLLPGADGAILTTADGKSIVLDAVQNGIVTKEENTEAVKQDNKLVYSAPPGTPGTGQVIYNTLTTPKGRRFQLVLADGSKVWLNAASSITFPTRFTGNERKVTITGEAYFEIAASPNPSEGGALRPFTVEKGDMQVQVLGTHFNVNAYEDENAVKVTLLEGSVKVKSEVRGERSEVTIKPGQQAIVTHDSRLTTHNSPDLDQVMAWKNGLFSFTEANITEIMRQVARWYDAEVIYEGNVKQEYFSGTAPRSANASVLLKVMETTNTVKFDIKDGKIFVRPVK